MPAPKKAATKTAEQKQERDYANFLEYRDRALALKGKTSPTRSPYVLGPDQGFDPPIEIALPKSTRDRFAMDEFVRQERLLPALQILVGRYDFDRICNVCDAIADDLTASGEPTDGATLVTGLIMSVFEYFSGKGASDVPGGSPAS